MPFIDAIVGDAAQWAAAEAEIHTVLGNDLAGYSATTWMSAARVNTVSGDCLVTLPQSGPDRAALDAGLSAATKALIVQVDTDDETWFPTIEI